MKSTGIVRKVDQLGRVVVPIELRRNLGIGEKDPLEIFVNGNQIVLQKYEPGCTLCGSVDTHLRFRDKIVCHACIDTLKQ